MVDERTQRSIENPAVRYEPRDIGVRGVLVLMVVACGVLVVIAYVVWRFYWFQAGGREAIRPSPYAMTPGVPAPLPPEPRLEQVDRMAGIETSSAAKLLSAKEKVLNSYGPAAEKGFVHIPIQQAMKTVAAEARAGKLGERRPSPPAKDQGLLDSGESNSGRVFRGDLP